jgi:sodium-dependent dicarboxylate transporter 2/3/5
MLPVVWLWLSRGFSREKERLSVPDPGAWQTDQARVLIVFGLAAFAWMTRTAPFGGWSTWLQLSGHAGDSTVALAAVVALFTLPSGSNDGARLLDWETANRIPWGLFSIIGGGIAIGMAFRETDLSAATGRELLPLAVLPLPVMIFCLCLFATFFTEFATNTAVAGILMPVMAAVATSADVNPMLVMIPVTLGLNWSFMLPAATVTNAMVYGTGEVTIQRMMREGFVLNLIGAVLVSTVCYLTLS